ncbi:MAG TPA: hypothetical protein DCG88_04380, partial [Sphingobacterium sp.]|nr:hypothetical protein [Sphingobacterium sp.]
MQSRFIQIFYFIVVLAMLSSCKSYKVVPNGFAVQGDEYFVNINKELTVFLGDDIMEDKNWQGKTNPINAKQVDNRFRRVLRHLRYSDTAYQVLFSGHLEGKYQYDMLAVVNNSPNVKGKKNHLLDLSSFQREQNKEGRYFYTTTTFKGQKLLHFVIPFNGRLWQEKMVSLIFLFPEDFTDIAWAKDVVMSNVAMYRDRYKFTPSRTEI